MLCRTIFCWDDTSNPATNAWPLDGLSSVVSIIIVVLFPAPFGPKNPKISPSSTAKEIPSTALVPEVYTLVRSLVSIECTGLTSPDRYKMLGFWKRAKFSKKKIKTGKNFFYTMKGLCHVCCSSNVEVTLDAG